MFGTPLLKILSNVSSKFFLLHLSFICYCTIPRRWRGIFARDLNSRREQDLQEKWKRREPAMAELGHGSCAIKRLSTSCSYLFRTCCEPRTRVWFPSLGKRLVREWNISVSYSRLFYRFIFAVYLASSFTRLFSFSWSLFARVICSFLCQILDNL